MFTKMDKEAFKESMMEAKVKEQEESEANPDNIIEKTMTTLHPRKKGSKKPPEDYVIKALEKANKQEESIKAAISVMNEKAELCLNAAVELTEKAEKYHEYIRTLESMME